MMGCSNGLRVRAPDCFVTLDCKPGFRRMYKVWEKDKPPDVVFEVTSNSTRRQDEDDKPSLYGEIWLRGRLFGPLALRAVKQNRHMVEHVSAENAVVVVNQQISSPKDLADKDACPARQPRQNSVVRRSP